MVSIQPQNQYITDFNSPINSSMDKNPLAMLEKTCETIGLPDTPAKKSQNSPKTKEGSPTDAKKDDTNGTSDKKKQEAAKSPKVNGALDKKITHGCEPSTSMAGMFPGFPAAAMFQRYLPFGANGGPMMPPTSMPGFPGLPGPFSMPPFGPVPASGMPHPGMVPGMPMVPGAMPSPHMVNGRPCMTPGCQTCAIMTTQAHAAAIAASMGVGVPPMAGPAPGQAEAMMQQLMMQQFLAMMQQQYAGNPAAVAAAAAAQNGVQLPPTSVNSKTSMDAYNNLMAAATGQLSRQVCPYVDNGVPCGKTFGNPEEMLQHYKSHIPNPPATTSTPAQQPSTVATPTSISASSNVTSSTPNSNEKKATSASPKTNGVALPSPSASQAQNRFHPYARPGSNTNPTSAAQAQAQAQAQAAQVQAAQMAQAQAQAQAASMAQAQQQMQMQQMLMQAFGMMPGQPGAPPMAAPGIPASAAAAFGMPPNGAPFNPAAYQAMFANARMLGAGIPGMPQH